MNAALLRGDSDDLPIAVSLDRPDLRSTMPEFRIESVTDPRIEVYRNTKKTNLSRYQDLFIVEGKKVAERLFRSAFDVHSVLASDEKLTDFRPMIPQGVNVYTLTKELATELVGYPFHRGILAAGHRQESPRLASVLPASGASVVFVADHIVDPQNAGLLIRTAVGFGAHAVIFSDDSTDPFSRRAIRVSMGNSLYVPIVRTSLTAPGTIEELERAGYTTCATVLAKDAHDVALFPFPKRTAIILGNETHGIRERLVAQCDHRLAISMHDQTDSLNVAVAAAVFGYAYRSRHPAA